jgi:hypothetical protein
MVGTASRRNCAHRLAVRRRCEVPRIRRVEYLVDDRYIAAARRP